MYLGEDWSSRQLRKTLIEEYPYLQPRRMTDGQVSPDYDYQFIVGEYDLPYENNGRGGHDQRA
jgi:hypothetical protein